MYTFVNAVHSKFNDMKYGYVYVIDSYDKLYEYIDGRGSGIIAQGFENYLHRKENHMHFTSDIAGIIDSLSLFKKQSPLVTFTNLGNDVHAGMLKMFQEFGKIYIQKCGSYMSEHSVKILNTVHVKEFVWPNKNILTTDDISIIRWPNGKHHYLNVNGVELGKFNNIKNAEITANEYIKKHNKLLKGKNKNG